MGAEQSTIVMDLSGFVPRDTSSRPGSLRLNTSDVPVQISQGTDHSRAAADLQAAIDVIRAGKDKHQTEAALRRMELIHQRMHAYIVELQTQNKELEEKNKRQARLLKMQEKSLQSWKKLFTGDSGIGGKP